MARTTYRDIRAFTTGMEGLRRGFATLSDIKHQRAMEQAAREQRRLREENLGLARDKFALQKEKYAEFDRPLLEQQKREMEKQNQVVDLDSRLAAVYPHAHQGIRDYLKKRFPHYLEKGPAIAMTQKNLENAFKQLTDKDWSNLINIQIRSLEPAISQAKEKLTKLRAKSGAMTTPQIQQAEAELNQLIKQREHALTFLRQINKAQELYDPEKNMYYKELPDGSRVYTKPGPERKPLTLKPGEALVSTEGKILAEREAVPKPLAKSNLVRLRKGEQVKYVPAGQVEAYQRQGWRPFEKRALEKTIKPADALKRITELEKMRAELGQSKIMPQLLATLFEMPELADRKLDPKNMQRVMKAIDNEINYLKRFVSIDDPFGVKKK